MTTPTPKQRLIEAVKSRMIEIEQEEMPVSKTPQLLYQKYEAFRTALRLIEEILPNE